MPSVTPKGKKRKLAALGTAASAIVLTSGLAAAPAASAPGVQARAAVTDIYRRPVIDAAVTVDRGGRQVSLTVRF